jgi:replicative DNA helicase
MSAELALVPDGALAPEAELPKYNFDEEFQSKIAALVVRSTPFAQRTDGLVKPEYLANEAEAKLVQLALDYYGRYKRIPADRAIYRRVVKEALDTRKLRKEDLPALIGAIDRLFTSDLSDAEYVVEQVATFARHQEVTAAMAESIPKLDIGDFDFIQRRLQKALMVGAAPESAVYDFKGNIEARTAERKAILAGERAASGITTGFAGIDRHLYHKGWGRRELSVLMGGAKAGKTLAMMEFGISAAGAGYNVLYVTLEVSQEVLAARMDSNLSGVAFGDLGGHIFDVMDKVRAWNAKAADFRIVEFPSGAMTVSDLRRMLEHFKARGWKPDLLIVDYADIMRPEKATDSVTENSKSIYVNLRGLAMAEDIAILTATQTNREGFKAAVAKAEHVAEDFNKIRIADIVLSLNASEDEQRAGEARIYFAAVRNGAAGFTIRVKQDRSKMKFIEKILGEE